MNAVKIHGLLLLLALAAALPTWLRDPFAAREGVLVWDGEPSDVRALSYRSDARDVDIERRVEGADTFYWGREVTRPAPGAADTLEFPVGSYGAGVVGGFAALRVPRTLGPAGPERAADLGLAGPAARITVRFGSGTRSLALGDSVYGGSDRYALDERSATALVLPADLVGPLVVGSGALRERQLHRFPSDRVAGVRLELADGVRLERRRADTGSAGEGWSRPDAPDRPDPVFADFMERLSRLAIERFEGDVETASLRLLTRVEYFDREGERLGFLELFRRDGTDAPTYFVRSERTRVPAVAIPLLAERVEEALLAIG